MRRYILALLALVVWTQAALADSLPSPKGAVILELRDNISNTNAAGVARFDLAMLRGLGEQKIATSTPWTEGKAQFDGVLAAKLFDVVGAKGKTAVFVALNDYKVELSIEELRATGAFLAFAQDGKTLTARDKGPLWLLFPFDSVPQLKTEMYFGRSIWQIKTITIK